MEGGIFVTGGSGNTGRAFLSQLCRDDAFAHNPVTCLCRPGGRRERLKDFPVTIVEGDAADAHSLGRAYGGEGTVVHVSSILHTRAVLEACRPMRRLVAVSSTGVYSKYRDIAAEIASCEREIERSGVPFTILQPTMIYGTGGDRNVSRLIRMILRSPVIPLPAMGRPVFQPVLADDLAACILSSLKTAASIGKRYVVAGGSAHTLREMVGILSELLGKKVLAVPVPLRAAYALARIAQAVLPRPAVTAQQVLRLLEDKAFDITPAVEELGFRPVPFREGALRLIRSMNPSGGRVS